MQHTHWWPPCGRGPSRAGAVGGGPAAGVLAAAHAALGEAEEAAPGAVGPLLAVPAAAAAPAVLVAEAAARPALDLAAAAPSAEAHSRAVAAGI